MAPLDIANVGANSKITLQRKKGLNRDKEVNCKNSRFSRFLQLNISNMGY